MPEQEVWTAEETRVWVYAESAGVQGALLWQDDFGTDLSAGILVEGAERLAPGKATPRGHNRHMGYFVRVSAHLVSVADDFTQFDTTAQTKYQVVVTFARIDAEATTTLTFVGATIRNPSIQGGRIDASKFEFRAQDMTET